MTMLADAKSHLSTTIRTLRTYLIGDAARPESKGALQDAVESTYRLSAAARYAGLDEATKVRRGRLEAWIDEQLRTQAGQSGPRVRTREDFRREVEKQAAYTLLNRLVVLRLMEAAGLSQPAVLTSGWESRAYKDYRGLAQALVRGDESEGYAFLLQMVFEELALELPGIFGSAGIADLVPISTANLRRVVEALDDPRLTSCWTDDMTLGWVYQYWNDPERESLDAMLNAGGKLQAHEIASKTQMFTERYMVDWLLQNSLGPMWLAMCRKQGWTPEVEADGTLQRLEDRRIDWRARRDAGAVSLTELMPLHTQAERRWAYYLPQAIPDDAVAHAPGSVRDLKIIDPAVGSGHFLVVALDLLVALYREEARHREAAVGQSGRAAAYLTGEPDGEPSQVARNASNMTYLPEDWTDRAIIERILSHNLHGIDLDPRAVQIAAAALWLKARQIAPDAKPERLNLVASNLRLASLPDSDPALVELRREIERDTGIPGDLTDTLIHALRGADHLGSLLKIDHAVEAALNRLEWADASVPHVPSQVDLFKTPSPRQQALLLRTAARQTLLDRLEAFLARHTRGDDLGLRLRGEQLAAGVRFVRLLREGSYDLVVANPPYQGTSKMSNAKYIERHYPLGKADLYAAFLLRGLELARAGGVSAMLTMRNWMFIKQFSGMRERLLGQFDLRALGDFDRGAFEDIPDEVVSVAASVFRKSAHLRESSAMCPTSREDRSRDSGRTQRKRAAILCHVGRHTFDPAALKVVPEWPLVYWWSVPEFDLYARYPTFESLGGAVQGISTANNARFIRFPWEILNRSIFVSSKTCSRALISSGWVPYIKGAAGIAWIEPLSFALEWKSHAVAIQEQRGSAWRNNDAYFKLGVSFPRVGSAFSARMHRFASVFDAEGPTLLGVSFADGVTMLNSERAKTLMGGLNPTIHFTQGDVSRLPVMPIRQSADIMTRLEHEFLTHESHREPSVEFKHAGASPWRHAQAWAQLAVDRPAGAPLPNYQPEYDPEPPSDHLSYALGVALGRFGANGEGILDPAKNDLGRALSAGILFLDGTLEGDDARDSLGHAAAAPLHAAWAEHGPAIAPRKTLREWLARDFFRDVHKPMYENRPIHWPLSSAGKTFVAWINIHRFDAQTLRLLLADHLEPLRRRLDGELNDLRSARDGGGDKKKARDADRRHDQMLAARDELHDFLKAVEQCADRGPPPTDARCPPREQDARYNPNLDDGVMVNSAALWPLLDPQWKDPKKWWKELTTAQGRKDYDWSHLAMRYWPSRVDGKCQSDPSLGVAHGCFWRYHPARAWAWELRLQDEIGPDFRISEAPYRPGGRDLDDPGDFYHRPIWLLEHPSQALAAVEKEALRRMGRGSKRKPVPQMRILEAGLWSAIPDEVWEMELRIAEKQCEDFRLRSPDEGNARGAFEAANAGKVEARAQLLAGLAPLVLALQDEPDDADAEDASAETEANEDDE